MPHWFLWLVVLVPSLARGLSVWFYAAWFYALPGWRDLWRSSSPSPLLQQGQQQQVAQDPVQMALEYLQRWKLHNLSGQPVPLISPPRSEEVSPYIQMDPVLQFVPVASRAIAGHY